MQQHFDVQYLTTISDEDYIVHPAVLDASLHVLCYRPFHANLDANVYYLPDRIRRVILHHPPKAKYFPSSRLYVHHKIVEWLPGTCIVVFLSCKLMTHHLQIVSYLTLSSQMKMVWSCAQWRA